MTGDAHCHLSLLRDPDEAVYEGLAAGVSPILAVSMDADEAEAVLALRDRHRGAVLAGAGLHPSRIVELSVEQQREHLLRIEGIAEGADFIGEIGLDYKDAREEPQRARQWEALERLLDVAAGRRLPVNLHTRRADREVMEAAMAFHEKTGLGALMHWFTHSSKLARSCAERGIFISAGPSVLVSERTAAVARCIDASILLVETDTPVEYGTLGPARPAWAARVLRRLAELRQTDVALLSESVRRNLANYLERS